MKFTSKSRFLNGRFTLVLGLLVLFLAAACGQDTSTVNIPALSDLTAPAPSSAGQVVVSEIYYDPNPLADTEGEWVEIYNPNSLLYSLKGCILRDAGTDTHTIYNNVVIPPGGSVTLAAAANPGFTPDYVHSSFTLGNTGDEVILDCGGTVIDQVVFAFGTFPVSVQASMTLKPGFLDATSNDNGANWCTAASSSYTDQLGNPAFGTPGAANKC